MLSLSELGIHLKTAREEKGFTLEELQTLTKIQKRYLVAIEEGDFSRLPGDFYARAFVKSYADAVGLNPELLFEEYRDELPKTKQDQVELPPRMTRSKPRPAVKKKSKFTTLLPTLVVAIFLIAVVGFLWYSGLDNGNDQSGISRENLQNDPDIDNSVTIPDEINGDEKDKDNGETGNNETEDLAGNDEINQQPDPEPLLEYVQTQGSNSNFTLSNTDEFHVTMRFVGQSWVRILDANGSSIHEKTYQANDETTFDFSDQSKITFHLGSSRTTEILVNGQLIEYPINNTVQFIIIDFQRLNQ